MPPKADDTWLSEKNDLSHLIANMPPKTNEEKVQKIMRAVASEEYGFDVEATVREALTEKDKERGEAWQIGFDRGVEAQMEVGGKEREEAVAEAYKQGVQDAQEYCEKKNIGKVRLFEGIKD